MSYCCSGLAVSEMDIEERFEERVRQKQDIYEEITAAFPGVPYAQARQQFRAREEARETTAALVSNYWPYLLAGAAGLLLFLFVKR